jgi:HEAT repeat protein
MTSDRPVCRLTIAILAEWVSQLESKDLRSVAHTLARLNSRECIPLLSTLAQDTDTAVRVTAAVALARLSEPLGLATLETLRHADADWQTRQHIAAAFGRTNAPAAVEPLLDMLDDSDYDVRMAAAKSLGLLKQEAAIPALRQAAERDSYPGVRAYATEAQAKLEEPADRGVLLRMTQDSDAIKQYLGAIGLLKRGDPTGIEVLGKLTSDENEPVQRIAASALCSGQVHAPANLLLTMARSKNPYIRAGTAQGLSKLDGQQPFQTLLAMADDEAAFVLYADDPELFGRPARANLIVAEIATEALASSRGPEAVEALLRQVHNRNSWISRAAARALASRTQLVDNETASSWAQDSSDRVREAAAELMGARRDPGMMNDLLALAEDSSTTVRAKALAALGQLGDERVVDQLISGLAYQDPIVQWGAASGLEAMAEQAVDILIERMNQADGAEAPANAIWLLDKLGEPEAVRLVIAARGTGEPAIWQRVVTEAVEAGDRSITGSLIAALKNGNPRVRECAIDGLAVLGGRDAVIPVAELMSDPDWEVRLTAASTLSRIGPSAMDLMAAVFLEGNKNMRVGMASLLGRLQAPETVDALVQALQDPGRLVRANAAEALGRTGDPRAVNPLIQVMDDPDEDRGVRNNAAAALRRLDTPEALARVRVWTLARRRAAARLAGEAGR